MLPHKDIYFQEKISGLKLTYYLLNQFNHPSSLLRNKRWAQHYCSGYQIIYDLCQKNLTFQLGEKSTTIPSTVDPSPPHLSMWISSKNTSKFLKPQMVPSSTYMFHSNIRSQQPQRNSFLPSFLPSFVENFQLLV